uniref:glycosyltransferase family 4 protein n=1 Tax=Deinococcus sp. TaxID=47478 RepID=UPI0025F59964
PLGLRPWYRQVYRSTKGPGLRRADGVMTVSTWGEAFLRTQFGVEAACVPNGVDTERYRSRPEAERQALRSDFGFTRFTVLVPGRMALEKNQLAALRTARLARELDFVFVGDMDSPLGMVIQRLKTLWRLDNVRLLGKRWDMPELYAAADALLQPTLAENQSLVTLEAMACGLCVVSSAIPAQAELITDGVDGLLLPPVPDLLVRALRFLEAHPATVNRLGEAARARVERHHTLSATAAALAALLHRAANRLD